MLAAGTKLGPYEILAPLGAGGMGEVYRARDSRLGREVAVKVLRQSLGSRPELRARFEREAQTISSLNHPSICTLFDVGREGDQAYLVMELIAGESLRSVLAGGPLPVLRAMDYATQAAEGLAAAHAKGIVHRDLKPENLLVAPDGRIKILDFGVAKLIRLEDPAVPGEPSPSMAGTMEGVVVGTLAYMAPEQILGLAVDARADIFALGIVLFEMLAGRRPFDGATTVAAMHAILHEDPPALSSLRPDAPADLGRILRLCLARDPERRMQTSLDVRNELQDLRHEMKSGPSAQGSAQKADPQPVERQFSLTAAHVRELSVRNPRLIGYPMTFLDNQLDSDTLVVLLHGLGGDYGRFEPALRVLRCRAIAPTLVGFGHRETNRPVLGMDDHSKLLRILLRDLVRECRPRTLVLVGYSAGADQFLRMIQEPGGAGVDIAGLLSLGSNVSIETCFASKLYAQLDAGNPSGTLEVLKSLAMNITSLSKWLIVQSYVSQTFMKLGTDLEPLKRYAADLVAPFETPGDPLADWYLSARRQIPNIRFVFSDEEAGPAELLLRRHLENNVLGDEFTESSFMIEPVGHAALLEPRLVLRHVEDIIAQATGEPAPTRER